LIGGMFFDGLNRVADLPVRGESMLTLPVFSFKNFVLGNLMKYAVIRTGGKQYRVSEGDLVKVEKLAGEVGEKVTLPDVLFVGGNDDVKIGSPLVANAKVTGEIVGQIRAKKILVFKKKRRKSYSRQRGHRQYQTTLKITAIEA
jgi:large subunit ribosomal protein L21